MRGSVAALTVALVLSACGRYQEVPNGSQGGSQEVSRTVYNTGWDSGGWVPNYVEHIRELNSTGTLVVIDNYCASSCTMYLGADNVCIKDTEVDFEFHGTIPVFNGTKEYWDAVLSSYYPKDLKDWFYQKAYRIQGFAVSLDAIEVSELSGVPFCHPH